MGKPKFLKKEVRQSSSNGNNPSLNHGKQSVLGSDSLPSSSRQRRRLRCNVVRNEPDLVASVQYDSEWKKPFKCVACGRRFGWRLERDSHELVCLDQISGQALFEMKTETNNLQSENQTMNKRERVYSVENEEEYYGSRKYVHVVDANANFQDLGDQVEIATESKCNQTDIEKKLENASRDSDKANNEKSYFDQRIQANITSHLNGLGLNGKPISLEQLGIVDKPAGSKTSHNRIFLSELSKFPQLGASSISSETMEELLDFRLDEADHFEVAGLLSSLNSIRLENAQMEKSVENLSSRKQQLLATRHRLLSLSSSSFDASTRDSQSHDNSLQLSAATPSQLSAPISSQISAATPSQLLADMPSQLSAATPSQLFAATPSQLSTAIPSQLSAATPSQVFAATPSQLFAAMPSQLSAATPSQLSAAMPSQLSAATPSQLFAATPSRLSTAMPSQLSAATPSQLSTAMPPQLSVATPSQLSAATPSQLSAATSSQLSAATPSHLLPVTAPSLRAVGEAGLKADHQLEVISSPEKCQESTKGQKIPVIVSYNPRHGQTLKCPMATMRKQF